MLTLQIHDGKLTASGSTDWGSCLSYDVSLEICQSPTCHCYELTLCLDGHGERRSARLNLDTRHAEPDEGTSAELVAQQAALAKGLDDESWAILSSQFIAAKSRAIASVAKSDEVFDFPFDRVELESELIAFGEVFPFWESDIVSIGDTRFAVDEMFCVRSACSCSDVFVAFIPEGSGRGPAVPTWEMSVNYRKGVWTGFDERALSTEARAAKQALMNAVPGYLSAVATRHAHLRALYTRSKADFLARSRVTVAAKVGRNEPCPCGSGKKHKRCCGA